MTVPVPRSCVALLPTSIAGAVLGLVALLVVPEAELDPLVPAAEVAVAMAGAPVQRDDKNYSATEPNKVAKRN